jgi:hypothetical protein
MPISNPTTFVISMLGHQKWSRRRKLGLGCWRSVEYRSSFSCEHWDKIHDIKESPGSGNAT